jgi:hypothetical protein
MRICQLCYLFCAVLGYALPGDTLMCYCNCCGRAA